MKRTSRAVCKKDAKYGVLFSDIRACLKRHFTTNWFGVDQFPRVREPVVSSAPYRNSILLQRIAWVIRGNRLCN